MRARLGTQCAPFGDFRSERRLCATARDKNHAQMPDVTWDLGAEEEDVCPMIVDITPTPSVESLGSCSV